MNFELLQKEVGSWSRRNFPNNTRENPFLGVVEEVGELAHAILKSKQGIRGTPEEHRMAEMDAVGDILIYLADFCERSGFDLNNIVNETWETVRQRDWTRNKINGVAV